MTLDQWEDEMIREALKRAGRQQVAGGAIARAFAERAALSAVENRD